MLHTEMLVRGGFHPPGRLRHRERAGLVPPCSPACRASAHGSRWRSCRRSIPPISAAPLPRRTRQWWRAANGVGPKLAERIVRELKDKIGGVAIGGASPVVAGSSGSDAVSALLNLGFRPAEASAAVAAAEEELGGNPTLDALVRLALRKASRA